MSDLGFTVWRLVHRYRDPVMGTLRLTTKDRRGSRVKYVGVVSAPGLAPTPVAHWTAEPAGRWVMDGMDLPIVVDRAAPTKLKVRWKQVPTMKQYRANPHARRATAESFGAPDQTVLDLD